jgi:hypothetical protein
MQVRNHSLIDPIDPPAAAEPTALLISDREAAALAGVSRSTWHILRAAQGGYRSLGKERAVAVKSLIQAGMEPMLPSLSGFFFKEKSGLGPTSEKVALRLLEGAC